MTIDDWPEERLLALWLWIAKNKPGDGPNPDFRLFFEALHVPGLYARWLRVIDDHQASQALTI